MPLKVLDRYFYSASLISVSLFFLFFYEFVFFATADSFLSNLSLSEKIILPLVLFMPCFLSALLPAFMGIIGGKSRLRVIIAWILSCLVLVAVDHFVYSFFKVGIASSFGLHRALYTLVFFTTIFFFLRAGHLHHKAHLGIKIVAAVLMTASVVCMIYKLTSQKQSGRLDLSGKISDRYNIILFGGDGISASRTSLYGYGRDTTPFLREFFDGRLVYKRAYASAGRTSGSLPSLLAGKYPSSIRAFQHPSIVRGRHVFEHLPAILKNNGYATLQVSSRIWADSADLNMLNSFDRSNFRNHVQVPAAWQPITVVFSDEYYFFRSVLGMTMDKLLHILWIRPYKNPFEEVSRSHLEKRLLDEDRMEEVFRFIAESEVPFFLHVHLMETNGPFFRPSQPRYSMGQAQNKPFMKDFYDDAVSDVDSKFKNLIDLLKTKELLDNTIIVFYSDHGRNHNVYQRVPLAFYFPKNPEFSEINLEAYAGLVDVAPTILDYLSVPRPGWMEGVSLISNEPRKERILYLFDSDNYSKIDKRKMDKGKYKPVPPLYGLKRITAVHCGQMLTAQLKNSNISSTSRHTIGNAKDIGCDRLSDDTVISEMKKHLNDRGYRIA